MQYTKYKHDVGGGCWWWWVGGVGLLLSPLFPSPSLTVRSGQMGSGEGGVRGIFTCYARIRLLPLTIPIPPTQPHPNHSLCPTHPSTHLPQHSCLIFPSLSPTHHTLVPKSLFYFSILPLSHSHIFPSHIYTLPSPSPLHPRLFLPK